MSVSIIWSGRNIKTPSAQVHDAIFKSFPRANLCYTTIKLYPITLNLFLINSGKYCSNYAQRSCHYSNIYGLFKNVMDRLGRNEMGIL